MVDLGLRLKELRKNAHMTQEAVARRVGVSKAMLSSYELESRSPSYEVLIKLASLFNVSTDYLLHIEKTNTVSVDGLSDAQLSILLALIEEFRNTGR